MVACKRRCAEGYALGRGDPAWLEVYGWASWTPRKGILVLRNPSDHEQTIGCGCRMRSNCRRCREGVQCSEPLERRCQDTEPAIVLQAEEAHEFHLAAFQVLTLDILPAQSAISLRVRPAEGRMDAMITLYTSRAGRWNGQPVRWLEAVDPGLDQKTKPSWIFDLRRPARGVRESRVRDPEGDGAGFQRKDRVAL